MLLFVYGTLMRGERAHHLLDRARFKGEATTLPFFRLVRASGKSHRDGYPGLVRGVRAVRGEVWEVDGLTLAELDLYEGCPWLYERAPVNLEGYPEGAVQGYLYARPVDGMPTIESGDWRQR